MQTETKETDAKSADHIGFYSCATVPADFARRLERERDQLRKVCDELYLACGRQGSMDDYQRAYDAYNQLPHVKEKNK